MKPGRVSEQLYKIILEDCSSVFGADGDLVADFVMEIFGIYLSEVGQENERRLLGKVKEKIENFLAEDLKDWNRNDSNLLQKENVENSKEM
uniref:Uncharacterized protein n=1 Tax=Fervidobacterium pennivorans TaxID=93466 RepID=A0A7V4NE46_FERPE